MTRPITPSPLAYGAVGDAYGFCFEFADPEFVAQHNDLKFHQHPEFGDVVPGVYSDDTQMQLALGELIAAGSEWQPEKIAEQFVLTYKRDPRPGYAKRFRGLLDEIDTGSELIARINPDSERNGAAMRAPIIGLLGNINVVIEYAQIQAAITHNTKGGIESAVASALMCHFFTHELGTKEELPSFLSAHLPGYDWSPNWDGPVPVHGISTVHAALTTLTVADSLSDLLRRCVAFTGDVDSVATIACACVSNSRFFVHDLPDQLWQGVESTPYGLPYLEEVDRLVWARAKTFDDKRNLL